MITKYSLDYIRKVVEELAFKIEAPADLLPGYGWLKRDALPYIEVDHLGFMYFIVSERGEEYERKKTDNIDELLYWIFTKITFFMAVDYEHKNRIDKKDCRRIIFGKQAELLGILSDSWKQREIADQHRILKRSPFDDLAGIRATYWGELRNQGYSEGEIIKLAFAKYPTNSPEK